MTTTLLIFIFYLLLLIISLISYFLLKIIKKSLKIIKIYKTKESGLPFLLSNGNSVYFSVIIPAFNEEFRILKMLTEMTLFLRDFDGFDDSDLNYEVILVGIFIGFICFYCCLYY